MVSCGVSIPFKAMALMLQFRSVEQIVFKLSHVLESLSYDTGVLMF